MDKIYYEMIDLINHKSKADELLNRLKIRIDNTHIPILNLDLTKNEKINLNKIIKRVNSCAKSRLILEFHKCLNCKFKIPYKSKKFCYFFNRDAVVNLYNIKVKCKYFHKKEDN